MNRTASVPRDAGQALVATLTLTFVFMAGAFIWLSRTVDRSLHDRSHAGSIAFQGARSGAQQVDLDSLASGTIAVDAERAVPAVRDTVARLLAANGDTGEITAMTVQGARVTVTVAITTSGRRAVGTSTVSARVGFDGEGQ